MLFTYSWKPRIDAEERGLLDAANCRAMFCHSDWYRDLIARNRGPANTAPIVTWPYPIDPWPGEPLPDEYDLLIYSKNGNRPGLLEHLCEVFPRHVVLHYGQYKREQLFEAARRDIPGLTSGACLMVVGVRTGAPFIRDGVTGVFVERLPPGKKCMKSDSEAELLADFTSAIEQACNFLRPIVRESSVAIFSAAKIVDAVLATLDQIRDSESHSRIE